MAKAKALPESNHFSRALDQLFKHDLHLRLLAWNTLSDRRIKVLDQVVNHWLNHAIFEPVAWTGPFCQRVCW